MSSRSLLSTTEPSDYQSLDEKKAVKPITYEEYRYSFLEKIMRLKEAQELENEKGDEAEKKKFIEKLNSNIERFKKNYPEHTAQFKREIGSIDEEISQVKCAKRWDICQISASILCFIPNRILLGCCICCAAADGHSTCRSTFCSDKHECGNWWTPLGCVGNFTRFKDCVPGLNFFCKPLGNIKEKWQDMKNINARLEELQELSTNGPLRQLMS